MWLCRRGNSPFLEIASYLGKQKETMIWKLVLSVLSLIWSKCFMSGKHRTGASSRMAISAHCQLLPGPGEFSFCRLLTAHFSEFVIQILQKQVSWLYRSPSHQGPVVTAHFSREHLCIWSIGIFCITSIQQDLSCCMIMKHTKII